MFELLSAGYKTERGFMKKGEIYEGVIEKIDFQNKVVKVKCKINQVVETASIDRAVIYISKTKLVDNVAKIAEKSFTNLTPGEHEFTFDLSDNGVTDAAKFLYARVGVKARQGNDYIFSEVTQLR